MLTKLSSHSGTTLIEILIATLVFVVALGALSQSLVAIMGAIDLSRDRGQATTDLRSMLERIRATPFDYLTTRFPNGTANGPVLYPYTNITGTYALRQENITVIYADPLVDPLEINVALTWQDKRGRTRTASMATFRTR
jgi:Tfp pilus assembly protein PilV